MEHKIVEKEEFKIVGMEISTSVKECAENNKIPALWEKFIPKVAEIKDRIKENTMYGVSFETGEGNFRHIACVEVSDAEDLPEGMVAETIPALKYAVFTHKGHIKNIYKTYSEIYEKSIPESGLKPKEISFELYDERYNHDSDDSECDIYVSVE